MSVFVGLRILHISFPNVALSKLCPLYAVLWGVGREGGFPTPGQHTLFLRMQLKSP